MLAAVLPGVDRALELVERPVPEPGPGTVRVRVQACGVCGSDLFLQKGGFGADKLPRVPGHEAAGVVDALGEDVTGWVVGEQVALYYIDADPEGRWARAGREQLDPALKRMGVDVDGAFAEYVVRPAHTLIRPPAPIAPQELAVLTDAVATPYHALVRVARVQAGERVLVLGIGGIGSNAVQLARSLGAHVVAASRGAGKLRLAEELGAAATVALGPGVDEAAALRAASPDGYDVVVQCVGSPVVDALAVEVAGPGGRIVLIGAATEPFPLRSTDVIWRELSVLGSRGFTARDIADVLRLHAQGRVRVDHLVSSQRPLSQVNAAFDDLRAGRGLRSVLRPDWT
jgi:2-desacetyl-2-hydroxyethyl bacteriochlorophyllide A dehydrogenase